MCGGLSNLEPLSAAAFLLSFSCHAAPEESRNKGAKTPELEFTLSALRA